MEKHSGNDIIYLASLDKSKLENLASIRHWSNLKIAFDEGRIWLKDFNYTQMDSVELKSIPFIKRFEERAGKLFPFEGILPEKNVPAVLWTPISRGLKIELPKLNHNYFGLDDTLDIKLVNSEREHPEKAMTCSLDLLTRYMRKAPAVRLKNLQWCLIHEAKALVFGTPLLSIPAETYWLNNNFLLPLGIDFEFPTLVNKINDKINKKSWYWILWNKEGTYQKINKKSVRELSISSFKKTVE